MKNHWAVLILGAALLVSGCSLTNPFSSNSNNNNPPPITKEENSARLNLDYAGVYQAKMACDDCDAVDAQLVLNANGQYRYSETKIKGGYVYGRPIVFEGRYQWLPNSSVIRFVNNPRNIHFFIAEGAAYQLIKPVSSFSELTNGEPRFIKMQ